MREVTVSWSNAVIGMAAGLLLSMLTSPVGVSGAVFLLPVQLDVLRIPSPAVTPTNLLFNVISVPGALFRHHRTGRLGGPLTRQMLWGTLPGVVLGAVIRVFVVPGPRVFRVALALLLLPLGVWLCARARSGAPPHQAEPVHPIHRAEPTHPAELLHQLSDPAAAVSAPPVAGRGAVTTLALIVGVIGGIYGIGGGSILGPILVGRGMPVAQVAPAALMSTFLTSVVGAGTYAVLALGASGDIAPAWGTGLACGVGGLIGGYVGTRLQPRLPEAGLRFLLGGLAVGLALIYLVQVGRSS
jgi:uncharacterized membrane protein YfcA